MQLNLIHSDYCKPIHDKRIDRIDERTIADILQPIWIDKKATADKLLVHLREIFRRGRGRLVLELIGCLQHDMRR